jgi:protein O-GlcNAc transferase
MLKRLLAEIVNRLNPARTHASGPPVNVPHLQFDASDSDKSNLTAELTRHDDALSCNELGERYRAGGKGANARACFERAIALEPTLTAARFNLGNLLFGANLIDEASVQYTAILDLQPNNADALNNLGMILLQSGRAAEAVTILRNVLKAHPDANAAANNLLLAMTLAPGHTPEELLEEHLQYAQRMQDIHTVNRTDYLNPPDPQRQLRIGYVSGDFKNHPVAWFMAQILAHHDAKHFEVYCYSNWYKADAVTDAIKKKVHAWRKIDELSDDAAAELVRKDGIDILVDLSGHSSGGRLGVFARKPAPVQMTYLGYANTTGLETIDYRITDAYCDPPGTSDSHYVEKLIRLPECMWCYCPHADMPLVSAVPAMSCGYVTFGSFNNAAKINSELSALWARVLHAVPASRLVVACLPAGCTHERVLSEFTAQGIDASRIELSGRLPVQEFWRLHDRVDIALDSFPCNGGTTTCDTLWMGVPVVTRCGERFASRAGYSILANAGLHELVAHDDDEYVAIASSFACDLPRLKQLRAGMRKRLMASPLLDVARFTRHLESAYRQAWETRCAARQPLRPLQIAAGAPRQSGNSI